MRISKRKLCNCLVSLFFFVTCQIRGMKTKVKKSKIKQQFISTDEENKIVELLDLKEKYKEIFNYECSKKERFLLIVFSSKKHYSVKTMFRNDICGNVGELIDIQESKIIQKFKKVINFGFSKNGMFLFVNQENEADLCACCAKLISLRNNKIIKKREFKKC